jgi:DNA-directed RNA polymerase sigma subunit (sigma70/sigma32)
VKVGGHKSNHCVSTCEEVAREMGITNSGVLFLERSALKKLRRSPTLFLHWLNMEERRSNNVGSLAKDEQ